MKIKIKKHTPVRYPMSTYRVALGTWATYTHNKDNQVKDITTDLDPQVDTTPDWYEDALEYKKFKGDWNKCHDGFCGLGYVYSPKQPLHKRLTKLFKRKS